MTKVPIHMGILFFGGGMLFIVFLAPTLPNHVILTGLAYEFLTTNMTKSGNVTDHMTSSASPNLRLQGLVSKQEAIGLGNARTEVQDVELRNRAAPAITTNASKASVAATTTVMYRPVTVSGQRQQNEKTENRDPSKKTTAGFIHIGKTGGSSLTKQLRHGCHSFVRKPCNTVANETIVSELVTKYYHVPDVLKIPKSRHQIYIVSARDPFERFKSAFAYTHPKNMAARRERTRGIPRASNRKAFKCFPSLEHFAQALGKEKGNCTVAARASVEGNVQVMVHLWGNYDKFVTPIHPDAKVYVIRKELLWDDWRHINKMLDPSRNVVVPTGMTSHVRDTKSVRQPVTTDLTDEGRGYLCASLGKEYDVFFSLLKRAVNLNETDLQEARELAHEHCPNLLSI